MNGSDKLMNDDINNIYEDNPYELEACELYPDYYPNENEDICEDCGRALQYYYETYEVFGALSSEKVYYCPHCG